ncbi:MAG: glycosyltransferase [Muribaculaceae bacterium]|nr:glycosyltransferase [Muribaculaceae bacterium]
MNQDNTISVILPVYKNDRSDYVRLSVDSILNQTYPNIELNIGVDGPIEEELANLLRSYESDDRIEVLWFKENRGLAVVLNDLLEDSFKKGFQYIARMDADDISMPDRLEKQMTFLDAHTDIDVVGGAIEEIDEAGNSRNKVIVYPYSPKECKDFFAKRNPHAHPAVLFRKSFFDKAGCLYRPEYRQNQDTMLWLDGMRSGTKHANIPDVVLKFRFTDSLFKKRRNGWAFANKQLKDRLMINKTLNYGLSADIFGYMMFCLLVSPPSLKKIAYRIFR